MQRLNNTLLDGYIKRLGKEKKQQHKNRFYLYLRAEVIYIVRTIQIQMGRRNGEQSGKTNIGLSPGQSGFPLCESVGQLFLCSAGERRFAWLD